MHRGSSLTIALPGILADQDVAHVFNLSSVRPIALGVRSTDFAQCTRARSDGAPILMLCYRYVYAILGQQDAVTDISTLALAIWQGEVERGASDLSHVLASH